MKIEMGESLMYSWLRHVKGCQVAQLNWKASRIDENMCRPLEEFYAKVKEKYSLKSKLYTFLRQAEIDVLGTKLDTTENVLYAADIAYHEGGLGYPDNIGNITKKMVRSALVLNALFGVRKGVVIFASPKVNDSIQEDLNKRIEELTSLFEQGGFDFEFQLILDKQFRTEIVVRTIKVVKEIKDTSDLFVRSLKLLAMFDLIKDVDISEAVSREMQTAKVLVEDPDMPEWTVQEVGQDNLADLVNNENVAPGIRAKELFTRLANEGKLNCFYSRKPDRKYHNYLLLKEILPGDDRNALKYERGSLRYYADSFRDGEREYFLVNDWVKRDTTAHLNKYLVEMEEC